MKIYTIARAFLLCEILCIGVAKAHVRSWNASYFSFIDETKSGVSLRYYHGKQCKVFNDDGDSVAMLSQDGPVKMDTIGLDEFGPGGYVTRPSTVTQNIQVILTNFSNLAKEDKGTYGQFLYNGKYALSEVYLNWTHEVKENMYFSMTIPVFRYKFTNSGYQDLTPLVDGSGQGFDQNDAHYKEFTSNFETILAGYGLSDDDYTGKAIGDIHFALDFKKVYEHKLFNLDALCGFIAPSGRAERLDHVFSIDYGYKKHCGFEGGFVATSCCSDKYQLQAGVRGVLFAKKTKTMRLYTSSQQVGNFIKLGQGKVREDLGALLHLFGSWQIKPFKDRNIFFTVGYAFDGQKASYLSPIDAAALKGYIVNTDPALRKWQVHSLFTRLAVVKEMDNPKCPWMDALNIAFDFQGMFAGRNVAKGHKFGMSSALVVDFSF